MLDQNTDRMWYVIGAVIVGAAIILILNGTMPQIFASVADTFQEKTGEVTTITDGIMPQTRRNLVKSGNTEKLVHNSVSTSYINGVLTETYIYYDLINPLDPHTEYTLVFDYYTTNNVASMNVFALVANPEVVRTRIDPLVLNNEWDTVTWSFATTDVIPESPYDGTQIRFDNNYSKDGKQATLKVKNVRLYEK